ncbi:carbohydrate kinase [Streptacidiphilus sp. N1-12]|uniref:Carbohydrate kinase n=2 Tax=Streptacidiphilus alkalitolerans TaxID=3342712 RepID=A0ABV6VHD1_9ACTN
MPDIPDASSTALPVLVVGEALTDVLVDPDGRRRACPGGSPANVALGLARLGHPVKLATLVGRDHFGRLLQAHLGGSGVLLTEGSVTGGPTSTATARIDPRGAASYQFDIRWDPAPAAVDPARTGPIAHLHTGSIAAALAPGAARVLAAVHAARPGATVSYDPNLRPALLAAADVERPRVEELVAASDLVKASDEDLGWLYPGRSVREVAARWVRSGPALVVVTLGAAGALAVWRHRQLALPAAPVQVSDSVGAGDAFMSGLIGGLLRAGLLGAAAPEVPSARTRLREATGGAQPPPELVRALSLAIRAAALTCTRQGADPPTGAELRQWTPVGS